MELTPEEIKRIDRSWKSDMDYKVDRLVRFADTHEPFLNVLLEREKARAKFWQDLSAHVAKVGAWSVISALFYAAFLGLKQLIRTVV